jgi:hypothetical protein
MEYERAIEQIESSIRRLKVQYDIFFAGGSKRPPVELRAELDRFIREVSQVSNSRYADRFALTTVLGKYHAFVELWNRQMRNNEEGVDFLESRGSKRRPARPPVQPPASPPEDATATRPSKEPVPPAAQGVLLVIRVSNPASEAPAVRELYNRYMAVRTEREGAAPRLAFESFSRQLSRQAQNLKTNSACDAVEFALTAQDSRIGIKARPILGDTAEARDELALAHAGAAKR